MYECILGSEKDNISRGVQFMRVKIHLIWVLNGSRGEKIIFPCDKNRT